MMFIGPFELLILLIPLLVGGLILVGILRLWTGGSAHSHRGGLSLGHTTLDCPHCGEETRAGAPTCEHCGRDL
jgi:hypothetical protein